jgi:hypothetical protein
MATERRNEATRLRKQLANAGASGDLATLQKALAERCTQVEMAHEAAGIAALERQQMRSELQALQARVQGGGVDFVKEGEAERLAELQGFNTVLEEARLAVEAMSAEKEAMEARVAQAAGAGRPGGGAAAAPGTVEDAEAKTREIASQFERYVQLAEEEAAAAAAAASATHTELRLTKAKLEAVTEAHEREIEAMQREMQECEVKAVEAALAVSVREGGVAHFRL